MKRILIAIAVCAISCNAFASAASPKIGVVNLNEVIQNSALSTSLNAKLSADFKPKQDEINSAQKKYQDSVDQLNYNGFKMTPDDRAKWQEKIAGERRALESMAASLQSSIAAAQAKYNQELMTKLSAVIKKIAADGGYDIIESNGNILFLNGEIDVTKQVVDQLK